MNSLRTFSLIAALCGLCSILTAAVTDINFVLPDNPKPVEETALQEVTEFLPQCVTGKLLAGGKEITEIQVGATAEALKRFPGLKDEEWVVAADNGKLFLVGGGPRGTYYAVAHFLEDDLNVHFWNLFERYVPAAQEQVELQKTLRRGRPCFRQRFIWWETMLPRDGGRYAAFNRLNVFGSHEMKAEYGGSMKFGSPELCHTVNYYFPEAEFGKTHPEYYALVGGKRVPGPGGQICLSNPEVVEVAWKKLQEFILKDEAWAKSKGVNPPLWYDFSANDNNSICSCPNCKKIIAEEGTDSGLILRVIRELALRLKKFRPGHCMTTIAYWNNEEVPKLVKLPDNVIVRLCNTAQNHVTPISAPGSAVFRRKLDAWSKAAKALGTWEYQITTYDEYFDSKPPFASEFKWPEQYRYFRDHKVTLAFSELQGPEFSDMQTMKGWLLAKMIENPDADFEKLRQTFLTCYYGPAAADIDAYRCLLRDAAKRCNTQAFTYNIFPVCFDYLTLDTLTGADKLLEHAMTAVGDDQVLQSRVRRARINLDNAILVNYRDILGEHLRRPGATRENFYFNRDKVMERYRAARKEAIDFNYGDHPEFGFKAHPDYGPGLMATMEKRQAMTAKLPLVYPREFRNPKWIEVPVNVTGFFRNELVPDPQSKIGFAAKANFAIRAAGYHDLPMTVGYYDAAAFKAIFSIALTPDKVPGPGYHWYRTPAVTPLVAGFFHFFNDWTVQIPTAMAAARMDKKQYCCYVSIKFTGPRYPGGKEGEENAVYIDRAFLVPAGVPFTLGKAIDIGTK